MPYAVLYAVLVMYGVGTIRRGGRSKQQKEDYNQDKGDAGEDADCRSGHCKKNATERERQKKTQLLEAKAPTNQIFNSRNPLTSDLPILPPLLVAIDLAPPPSPPHHERTAHQE